MNMLQPKLIRIVKRPRTALKVLRSGNVTIFRKTIYGYFNNDRTRVQKNIIHDKFYEIYAGTLTEYPYALLENHSVEKLEKD